MIRRILQIKAFGVFADFQWSAAVTDFKQYNLIYGWNYSGKTTLSRAFRCFELKQQHSDFPDAQVKLKSEDGTIYQMSAPQALPVFRVFNSDFVRDNLSFDLGSATPILVLGAEDITKQESLRVKRVSTLTAIADAIRAKTNPEQPDISGVMAQINSLLDSAIEGVRVGTTTTAIDLSKIDFEKLGKRFTSAKHKNIELESLKAAVRAMLERLIRLNRTRADYQDRFEQLIEAYNAGSKNIEDLFAELLALSRNLSDEEARHVRENLSEEELTILDILTRPAPELSTEERNEVKKVARDLLARVKDLLVLDWRGRASARSQVKLAIEDILDSGLPRAYTPEIYQQKCAAVFEHVYESYVERNQGVYAGGTTGAGA